MKKATLFFVLFITFTSFAFSQDGIFAIIKTNKGEVTIRLEYEKAPITVANFIGLAEGKIENTAKQNGVPFYNGLTFHRVENGAIIQGGCPLGNGLGNPGYKFANEIHKELKHNQAGIVAMANSGKNTNGSQFYITMRPIPQLDKDYSIFGQVVKGLGTVEMIVVGDKIISIKIERIGEAANAFDIESVFPKKNRKQLK